METRSVDAAVEAIDLGQLVADLVNIPSPTGNERPLAEFIAGRLARAGLDAQVQRINRSQANAVGRLVGTGHGPSVLLYAPIDTHTTGEARADTPWEAVTLRPDMLAKAETTDRWVVGLGANNPKGHAACVIAAAETLAAVGPLSGDVIVGLGAGGMPSTGRPTDPRARRGFGHGRGCEFMLDHGMQPDMAIIAKPGTVLHEEVGLAVIHVRIHGRFDYTGVRHRGPYSNPIVDAAQVVVGLEEWFAVYTARHTSGTVEPQASIGWIEAGWREKPTFVPAVCDLRVDLRISPRSSIAQVRHEFGEALQALRDRAPELLLDWSVVVAVPGTSTDIGHPVIQACVHAWEEVMGETYRPPTGRSGATDANILRMKGIPTARVGMLPLTGDVPVPDDFSRGMNVVDIDSARRLTQVIVRAAIEICGAPRP